MPSDFFADLRSDGVLDGAKQNIRRFLQPSFKDWYFSLDGEY